jgi:hypothetical protein
VGRTRSWIERVVTEHLVTDDRPVSRRGETRNRVEIFTVQERARGVVWRHDQNRAHAIIVDRRQRIEVDAPRAVVLQPISDRRHRFEPRQVLEQRIAWLRHEDRIAGVA